MRNKRFNMTRMAVMVLAVTAVSAGFPALSHAQPAPAPVTSADEPIAPTDDGLSSKTAEPDPDYTPTEDPNATVVPGEMRSDREEVPAGATKEMADKAETMEARQRMSRAAVGCQTYWPFPYEVCGVIRDKYNSLGGPGSFLSYPNSPEYTNPDGIGKRTQFLNGPIYWSPAGGAHPVVNSFLNRWGVHQYEAGWLKYPTTDEIVLPDGGRRQEFQQGAIYVAFQNAIGSAIANGPLRDKYNSVGGLAPGGTLLGYLTGDHIRALPDGQGQMARFERGVIYWHPNVGAQVVMGSILERWAAIEYEAGRLGYPTSAELSNPDGVGKRQTFQNGVIYWKDPYGARDIFGPMLTRWAESGYETGWLGYPVMNIGPSTGDWTTVSQLQAIFEGGGLFLNTTTTEIFEGVRVNTPE